MTPFRFGSPDHRLFATYHPPQTPQPAQMAVLLCNPFGQEAVRLHRFYKVLAERLARSGFAVMRFDYFGTGESDGDDTAGNLACWQQDVLQAHQELMSRSGAPHAAWFGARLGGTVALQAAARVPTALARLILWEPVLDGPAYLAQLAQDHVRSITRTGQPAIRPVGDVPAGQALGFGMSPALIEQVQQLQASSDTSAVRTRRITMLASPNDASLQRWAQSNHHCIDLRLLDVPFDWTSEEAMNTALVPPTALKAITAILEEPRS